MMWPSSVGKFLWRAIFDPKIGGAISTVSSILSLVVVIVGVMNYIASEPDQDVQRYATAWTMLNSSAQNGGQKYAIELLARHHVPMNSVVLKGDDLSKVKIRGANLAYSNIQLSNFSNADLRKVDFRGASLINDDFSYADLTGAALNDLNFAASGTGNAANNFTGAILPDGLDIKKFFYIACAMHTGTVGNLPMLAGGQVIHVDDCQPPRMLAPCVSAWCPRN